MFIFFPFLKLRVSKIEMASFGCAMHPSMHSHFRDAMQSTEIPEMEHGKGFQRLFVFFLVGKSYLPANLDSSLSSTSIPSNWICGKIPITQLYHPMAPGLETTSTEAALKG